MCILEVELNTAHLLHCFRLLTHLAQEHFLVLLVAMNSRLGPPLFFLITSAALLLDLPTNSDLVMPLFHETALTVFSLSLQISGHLRLCLTFHPNIKVIINFHLAEAWKIGFIPLQFLVS